MVKPTKIQSVKIDDVAKKNGWKADGVEVQALRAFDNGDGLISVDEIEKARRKVGSNAVTSVELVHASDAVGVKTAPVRSSVSSRKISELKDNELHNLAQRADLATGKPDGITSDSEVERYRKTIKISDLAQGTRDRELAERADKATGQPDGLTSMEEIENYGRILWGTLAPKGDKMWSKIDASGLMYLTNQITSAIQWAVADMTGEVAPQDMTLRVAGNDLQLLYPAMAVHFNRSTNVANAVVTAYYAEDLRLMEDNKRKENFRADLRAPVEPKIFSGFFSFLNNIFPAIAATFHKGHLIANDDFVGVRSQDDSFYTTNMHAQFQASNSVVWLNQVEKRFREMATREPGVRLVMIAGPLFHDKKLAPVPPERIQWISGTGESVGTLTLEKKKGEQVEKQVVTLKPSGTKNELKAKNIGDNQMVAVPTHTWKIGLIQIKDAKTNNCTYQAVGFIVENREDLPSTSIPQRPGPGMTVAQQLEKAGSVMVSLAELEKVVGMNLFKDLPVAIRNVIVNDPDRRSAPAKFELVTEEPAFG